MDSVFEVVVLGCTGGPEENNLSAYLISPIKRNEWICLDAGSLLYGIEQALLKNSLDSVHFSQSQLSKAGEMLIQQIKCFLISHAHLDHIAGLIFNSQVDDHKYILGTDATIDNLRDHIFNGKIWPNYGSEGVEPILSRYQYLRLALEKRTQIPTTSMHVEAFLLSHPHNYPSTAFLIEYNTQYLLYFGDTSSDSLEEEKHLTRVWERITPLLREGSLHGIFLECSYSQEVSDQALFGHLDSALMLKELESLSQISGVSLENFPIVVTHRKESIESGPDAKKTIREELLAGNRQNIRFIFPSQGERLLM